ncbi:MAG TPA: FtsK/SpoIIIE domain-containing protein [Dermatophilaceae bacterium]|nr:FtsK/SpoIIIE domain-containing protein [Dermatophilaceae bacterium]
MADAVRFHLTVVEPGRHKKAVEVCVDASPGATVAHLWPELRRCLHRNGESLPTLYAGAVQLGGDSPLGLPPLVQGAVLAIGRPVTVAHHAAGLLQLHVVEGPDSGTIHALGPGAHTVGRGPEATVRLDDPGLSRLHCRLDVTTARVRVTDLRSSNGTHLDDVPVGQAPTSMSPGVGLRVGRSTLLLRRGTLPPIATVPDGAGHLLLPRVATAPPPDQPAPQIRFPVQPRSAGRVQLPVAMLVLPMVIASAVAWLSGNALSLLLGLTGPLLILATYLTDRRRGKGEDRRARAEYRTAVAAVQLELRDALLHEQRRRFAAAPDNPRLRQLAAGPHPGVWAREPGGPGWLCLRLGVGQVRADTTVATGDGTTGHPRLRAPVVVDMAATGTLGLCGPRALALGLARSLVGQLAATHSPAVVRLAKVTAGDGEDWGWVRSLPHWVDPGQEAGYAEGSVLVVVLDRAWSADDTRAAFWLRQALTDERVVAICVEDDPSSLPGQARVVVVVAAGGRLDISGLAQATSADADLAGPVWANGLARSLGPLRATTDTPEPSLPAQVRLLDLLPFDGTDPGAVSTHWSARPASTHVVLGAGPHAPYAVDLAQDGPHLLIGGTTGAGKSELLQTLVASLALANRPDELCFVLVDYKGGASFRDSARLPHTLGLVTDLDATLTSRALRSLQAELKRRERMLAHAGAKDLPEYQRRRGNGEPLPRLVIVVDEFRMLAEELPAFLTGLVSVATVGRSLGVHLVLATQRPGGVVSADIKANVNLRIALRLREEADSHDIIDQPLAAGLPHRVPGRAYVRRGSGGIELIQTARVSAAAPGPLQPRVTVSLSPVTAPDSVPGDDGEGAARVPGDAHGNAPVDGPAAVPGHRQGAADGNAPVDGPAAVPGEVQDELVDGPTDLERIVDACVQAAARLVIPGIRSPWLPPLPDLLPFDTLLQPPATPSQAPAAAYGLVDDPGRQQQPGLVYDLAEHGHLGFAGGPRSGRTTALLALGRGFAACPVADVHVHGLEASAGSLRALADWPNVGTVVSRDQPFRASRLIHRLLQEVHRRRGLLTAAGFGSLAEQWARTSPGDPHRVPYLLLLIDGWEGVTGALDQRDHGRPTEGLFRLLREGPAVGLRAVVTGDRSMLTSRVASLLSQRFLLPTTEPTDLLTVGIPAEDVPRHRPPGRAVRVSDALTVQIAMPEVAESPSPGTSLRGTAPHQTPAPQPRSDGARFRQPPPHGSPTTEPWGSETPPSHRPAAWVPLRLRPLPELVPMRPTTDVVPAGWAFVGVGGDDLCAVGLDLTASSRSALVVGPPRSGRSTCLATMALSLASAGRTVATVGVHPSPLTRLTEDRVVRAVDAGRLQQLLRAHPDLAVVVDDAPLLEGSPLADVVLEALHAAPATGAAVLCSAALTELGARFRGLVVEVGRARAGILLNPATASDGDVFGIRADPPDAMQPGRGLVIQRGEATMVQVAIAVPTDGPVPPRPWAASPAPTGRAHSPAAGKAGPINPDGGRERGPPTW